MSPDQPGQLTAVDQVCPVCQWPDGNATVCGECGWQLLGDYALGPATWFDQREFDARLADRRRAHDLRAAVRAAGGSGERDQDRLERLAGLARHGPPPPEQVDQARADVDTAEPPVALGRPGAGFALTRLVSGQTEAIAFVEIGPDAISVQTLVAGPLGVPVPLAGDSLPWTAILPLPPDDEDLRYLRMAGGIGEPSGSGGSDGSGGPDSGDPDRNTAMPATLLAVVDEAVIPALSRLMTAAADGRGDVTSSQPPHRLDTVLVRRPLRWPVLDAALRQARALLRPVGEVVVAGSAGGLADVVADVASQAPLRYGYDLVLVHVDQDSRAVEIKPHRLFPAGAAVRPGAETTVPVEVAAVPGHAEEWLALPVVATRGPARNLRDPAVLGENRPLVTMAAMDGAATGTTTLRVSLLGPGKLAVRATPRLLSEGRVRADWPAMISGLPERLPPKNRAAEGGLDLVLLVELGGDHQTVAARVRLARAVVEAFRGAPAVRIALAGYRDHFGRHRLDAINDPDQEAEALVVGCGLTAPGRAQTLFREAARWKEVPIGDNNAAPIEDALEMIAGSAWGWRQQARHVLLVVGARPPHPHKEGPYGDTPLPCPHGFSWRNSLGRLRQEQGVECFAVLDRPRTSSYADQAWKRLGVQGVQLAGSVTAGQLARLVGTTPQAAVAKVRLAMYAGPEPDQ
jgi:hypothetical protein